jgi:hypothetical protein
MFGRFVVPRSVIRALLEALIHPVRLVLRLNLRIFTNCSPTRYRAILGIRSNRALQ